MRRSPLKRTPLTRRSRLKPVGAKVRREAAALRAFRQQVRINAGGLCQARTPACPQGRHEGHHAHHRCIADRRLGVHDAARGMWCCEAAHRHIHTHPEESYRRGWLLRAAS